MLLSGVGMLCGQALTTELIRFVEKTGQGLSRRQLSRQLCHQFDFRSPNGRPKEMACRKDLAKLVREQRVRLPERTWRGATRNTGTSLVCYPKIEGSLAEIGPVELILVKRLEAPWAGNGMNWRATIHWAGDLYAEDNYAT
jgi:hypothetical protein